MVEFIDNLLQFLVSLLGCCLSSILYCRSGKQAYFLLTCFYGCFALGGLYWTLYYFLFAETPHVFYVSETAWISSYIFLYLLQYTLSGRGERAFKCRAVWLSPLIGIPLLVFYCTYGDILFNVICCVMMMAVSWSSIRGLVYAQGQRGGARDMRYFHIAGLCFAILEYCLWTASCFWVSDTLTNPYFWFDFLLTAAHILQLPAVRKAVGR